MTEDQAREVERMLHRLGRTGVAAPADHADPAGEWRIYDRPEPELRRDITSEVLDALIAREDQATMTLPAGGCAVRGFVFPERGRG